MIVSLSIYLLISWTFSFAELRMTKWKTILSLRASISRRIGLKLSSTPSAIWNGLSIGSLEIQISSLFLQSCLHILKFQVWALCTQDVVPTPSWSSETHQTHDIDIEYAACNMYIETDRLVLCSWHHYLYCIVILYGNNQSIEAKNCCFLVQLLVFAWTLIWCFTVKQKITCNVQDCNPFIVT